MKRILSFAMFFIALSLSSCDNDEVLADKETDCKYTISFGTEGVEALSGTRASSDKTIYGINIEYYKNGTRQGFYAYGLFDDMSKATITLIGGFTYTFTCSIVRSAGDALWYGPYSSNSFSGYADPFRLNNSPSVQCLNRFVDGTGAYFSGLGSGTAVVKSSSAANGYTTKTFPSLERYYGKIENFNPSTDGTHVVIPVNKAYFGCKLIIKGVKDGTLSTSSSTAGMDFLYASTTTDDYVSDAQVYCFPNVAACWTNDSYSMKQTIRYDYTSNRSSLHATPDWWNLNGTKEITFKRNILTTITISVTEDLSGASIGIGDEALGEDNLIEFGVDENYNLYQKDN